MDTGDVVATPCARLVVSIVRDVSTIINTLTYFDHSAWEDKNNDDIILMEQNATKNTLVYSQNNMGDGNILRPITFALNCSS